MPLSRDSLPQLIAAVRGDLAGEWKKADTTTRRSPLDVFSRLWGYIHHTVNGLLAFIVGELMANTARQWLSLHGDLWRVPQLLASFAGGEWTATGTPGAVISTDARLRRGDGFEYAVDLDTLIGANGTAQVPIVAVIEGDAGNCVADTPLTLVSPIGGVTSTGLVAAPGLAGGADLEAPEAWKGRILARIRRRPHGGNGDDYDQWTRGVSSAITRVWVFKRESGPGTVTVRFMMDDAYEDGLPRPADVALVEAYLNRSDVAPATAVVLVAAPIAVPLNPQIRLTPDTPAVRATIATELRDLLRREGKPAGTLPHTHIDEAVSIAAGEIDHALLSPTASLTYASTEIPVLGTITWVPA